MVTESLVICVHLIGPTGTAGGPTFQNMRIKSLLLILLVDVIYIYRTLFHSDDTARIIVLPYLLLGVTGFSDSRGELIPASFSAATLKK